MGKTGTTYRIFALLMALLMFTTSTAYSVGMHYCNDELKSVSFNGEVTSCCDKAEGIHDQSCSSVFQEIDVDGNTTLTTKSCCQDIVVHFQLDQDHRQPTMNVEVSPELQYFAIAYIASYLSVSDDEVNIQTYAHYKPPMISKDIPVLIQSFLI